MQNKKHNLARTSLWLALAGLLLLGAAGCGHREDDQSDPNADYYKGKIFSVRNQKKR